MNKKVRTTIYIVGVLWIAVMSQIVVNRVFMNDSRIMDAFVDTDTNIEESKLNIVVDYGDSFLLNEKRENILKKLGKAAGIEKADVKTDVTERAVTMKLEEKSKKEHSQLEFISLTQKQEKETAYQHFILLELKMNQNFSDVIHSKKIMEKAVKALKAKDYQSVMKFTGSYQGKLSGEEQQAKVKKLLSNLQAKKVDSIKSSNYYTVYAYTGLVDDYIKANGKRININIAITYDEEHDKTEICLATPILNEDY